MQYDLLNAALKHPGAFLVNVFTEHEKISQHDLKNNKAQFKLTPIFHNQI